MTNVGGLPDDKRMRLRYAGTCRLCRTALPAGTDAVYERSRRTVRCVGCVGEPDAAAPTFPAPAAAPATDAPQLAADALRLRAPAASVICETLRLQSAAPPRSRAAKLFGRRVLLPEARPWFDGARGELEVGRILDQLGEGWHVVHAVPVGKRGSDIDHLVIGVGGVFTINTKRHPGKVWVGAQRLLVNGKRTDHLRNAGFEASRVARTLGGPVTPVIAIVAARVLTIKERPGA